MKFSSPSGDGLVREGKTMKDIAELFSSPSGDGLVRNLSLAYALTCHVFVPEWGWVGSE